MKFLTVILFLSSSIAFGNSCFYEMTEQEVFSVKKNKLEALTLVYDVSKCADHTLINLQRSLVKESKRSLSYLKARFDQSQASGVVGFFGSLGKHNETKQTYEISLSRIQSTLALVQAEIAARKL